MSSEDPQQTPEQIDQRGRLDRLPVYVASGALVVASLSFLLYVAVKQFGYQLPSAESLVSDLWPIPVMAAAGWILGKYAFRMVYVPDGRILIQLDPERQLVRIVRVPERMFQLIQQSGNNVTYHTPVGTSVYLVQDMDLSQGFVDYGWVHEFLPMVVMTRNDAYVRWHQTLDDTLRENIQIKSNPNILAIELAKVAIKGNLDGILKMLGFSADESERVEQEFNEQLRDQSPPGPLFDEGEPNVRGV